VAAAPVGELFPTPDNRLYLRRDQVGLALSLDFSDFLLDFRIIQRRSGCTFERLRSTVSVCHTIEGMVNASFT
jgi:hypothetical protein